MNVAECSFAETQTTSSLTLFNTTGKVKIDIKLHFFTNLKQVSETTVLCMIVLSFTGVSQVSDTAPANTVEDTAALSAISKQQILVQYLKASFYLSCFMSFLLVSSVLIWKCSFSIKVLSQEYYPLSDCGNPFLCSEFVIVFLRKYHRHQRKAVVFLPLLFVCPQEGQKNYRFYEFLENWGVGQVDHFFGGNSDPDLKLNTFSRALFALNASSCLCND